MGSAKQNHAWDRTSDQLVFISADISRRPSKGILRLETHRSSFPSLSGIQLTKSIAVSIGHLPGTPPV